MMWFSLVCAMFIISGEYTWWTLFCVILIEISKISKVVLTVINKNNNLVLLIKIVVA